MPKKIELYGLMSEQLEEIKERMLSAITEGKGSRELRNKLFEVLGVIDSKQRFPEPLILEIKDLA